MKFGRIVPMFRGGGVSVECGDAFIGNGGQFLLHFMTSRVGLSFMFSYWSVQGQCLCTGRQPSESVQSGQVLGQSVVCARHSCGPEPGTLGIQCCLWDDQEISVHKTPQSYFLTCVGVKGGRLHWANYVNCRNFENWVLRKAGTYVGVLISL